MRGSGPPGSPAPAEPALPPNEVCVSPVMSVDRPGRGTARELARLVAAPIVWSGGDAGQRGPKAHRFERSQTVDNFRPPVSRLPPVAAGGIVEASADDPSGAAAAPAPVLEAAGLVKRYGHVTALAGVDLTLWPSQIVALVGDNGAGKTTLVSCLTGLIQPDAGEIRLRGKPVTIPTPHHAQQLGIATIFQTLALVGQRDVASNIFAGREPVRLGLFVDRRRMVREAASMIADLRVNIPSVRSRVDELSGGQRQATAVVRALMGDNIATLMDEPTAALGVREAARVLELASRLRENGQAVLLISHNMESVFGLADRIVVLRHGRRVLDRPREATSREEVVGLLTGAVAGDAAP